MHQNTNDAIFTCHMTCRLLLHPCSAQIRQRHLLPTLFTILSAFQRDQEHHCIHLNIETYAYWLF